MFSMFYQRYKVPFWIVLTLLFLSGSVSKMYTGASWEVALNGGLGVVCLIISIVLLAKQRKKGK